MPAAPDQPATLNELCYVVKGGTVRLEAWLDGHGLEKLALAIPAIAARLSTARKPRSRPPAAKAPGAPPPPPKPARGRGVHSPSNIGTIPGGHLTQPTPKRKPPA